MHHWTALRLRGLTPPARKVRCLLLNFLIRALCVFVVFFSLFSKRKIASAPRLQSLEAPFLGSFFVQRSHHESAATVDLTLAGELDQLHGLDLARLEAHGRAGRQVQPHAVSCLSIENQCAIHLEKVKM